MLAMLQLHTYPGVTPWWDSGTFCGRGRETLNGGARRLFDFSQIVVRHDRFLNIFMCQIS